MMTGKMKERASKTMSTAASEDSQQEHARSRQEEEEQLILTAWRSMASALQQHRLCENSGAPDPAQSFLAKQRQSTLARRVLSLRLQPK